ncbi:MAG: hypothetical protein ACMUIA_06625 [bacterium]
MSKEISPVESSTSQEKKSFFQKFWKLAILWLILIGFFLTSMIKHFDKRVSGAVILLYGLSTQIFSAAFASLMASCAAIPWLGPVLVRILMWPVTAVVNVLVVSVGLIKVKQGNAKQVIGAKLAALLMAAGILIGYIIGKLL